MGVGGGGSGFVSDVSVSPIVHSCKGVQGHMCSRKSKSHFRFIRYLFFFQVNRNSVIEAEWL